MLEPLNSSTNHGFILTRHANDTRNGITLSYWLKCNNEVVKLEVDNELALFFVENQNVPLAKNLVEEQNIELYKVAPLKLKTFKHKAVTAFYFSSLRSYYQAKSLFTENNIKCYEDDIRPEERYLMERFVTASIVYSGIEKNKTSYALVNANACKAYENNTLVANTSATLSVVSIDIECSPKGELYSIGLYSEGFERVYMIGTAADAPDYNVNPDRYAYIHWIENEIVLLKTFIAWVKSYDPDIFIGWNVVNFDFRLLQKRCDLHGIEFAIGRDERSPRWRENKNSNQSYMDIAGRVVLDGIDVLKTATYSFPSFSLDNVANTLLGIGKKIEDKDNKLQEIIDNFHHHKEKLAAYNLEDCRLVWLVFEKTQLIDFALLRSQLTGLAIDKIGGSAAAFTNLYLPKLHRGGYVAPNLGDGKSDLVSPGGYVMDSIPGLYNNILVLDFKSLYPSIIRTFKIDPMGLIEGLEQKDEAIEGYDGAWFSRDKNFLPEIIVNLWKERDRAKRENNAALSQAIKIIMNSFYGVLGSNVCRFFDPRLSGSITKRSHDILKQTKQWIEAKGYKVIYGDTDSIFVHVEQDIESSKIQKLGLSIQDFINEEWIKVIKDKYQLESYLDIEFETHFTKFFMPTIRGTDIGTKKRYAGLVNNKGKEDIVFKGLESVRTDWTELSKQFQKELYRRVFNNLPVEDYVRDIVDKTRNGEYDELLLYRKRIKRKLKDYTKNVPPHVKAARSADLINKQQGKKLKYQNRGWIEYFITVQGPQVKEHLSSPLDYQFYIDRQLKAVADAILPFVGTSFDSITDHQLNLF